jgi:hypothetical protein
VAAAQSVYFACGQKATEFVYLRVASAQCPQDTRAVYYPVTINEEVEGMKIGENKQI